MKPKKTEFFLIIAPGTEDIATQELQEVWGYLLTADFRPHSEALPELKKQYGGISFSADLALGLQLHFWLKIPVRILVRTQEFFADEFYQLENALRTSDLKKWFDAGAELEFKIESQKSKLGQEKRILEVVKKVFAKDFKIVDEAPLRVYLRASQNQWTLSLDATGEPLYKRAWAPFKGDAPLRENLAASIWRMISQDQVTSELKDIHVYDPFAGSGTCLFEAALMFELQTQRSFSFLNWKQTPAFLKLPQFFKNYKLPIAIGVQSLTAADSDPQMIQAMQSNLSAIQKWKSDFKISILQKDFWHKENIFSESKKSVWIITNPPFGQRIPWSAEQKKTWLKHLVKTTNAQRIGFIYPQKMLNQIEFPDSYDLLSKTEFLHGDRKSVV